MEQSSCGVRWWINDRFIFLVEVAGYSLSAIICIGVIYSMFAKVDLLAHANGSVEPLSAQVVSKSDCVVLEFLAEPGAHVKEGQPVCRVAVTEEDRRLALAHLHAERVLSALEGAGETEVADTGAKARATLESIPPVQLAEELVAPAAGIVKFLVDAADAATIPAGAPVATVYQPDTLVLNGLLEPALSDRVAAEQPATVSLPGVPEPVTGKVIMKGATPETAALATLQFANPSAANQKYFEDALAAEGPFGPLSGRATITVGQQSLFVNMLGRKQ